MAAFPQCEKMPLELESELLNGQWSVATKDTGHAAQVMRWGGRRRRERSINSGAAISEKCLFSWRQAFILERSSMGKHLMFNTNNPSSAAGHRQDPLQCLHYSGQIRMVGLGIRRLRPDLHLARARDLLHHPQDERMGSRLSSIRDRGWLPLSPGQGKISSSCYMRWQ